MRTPGFVPRHLLSTVMAAVIAAVIVVAAASPSAARPVEHLDLRDQVPTVRTLPASASPSGGGNHAPAASAERPAPASPVYTPEPAPAPEPDPPAQPPQFAGVDNLSLLLPDGVTVVGFHEAASRRAVPLHPLDEVDSADPVIMASRGRGTAATSAVDLAIPPNWPLLTPVTGTIAWASPYLLYGRHTDAMVTIIPDARPDLQVVLLHLDTVHVRPGQRVVAGETIIASTARQLPFRSQIDKYAGHGPHVHVEVRRPG